jgi:hypothetical protein
LGIVGKFMGNPLREITRFVTPLAARGPSGVTQSARVCFFLLAIALCAAVRGDVVSPDQAITTTVRDALPVAAWLDDIMQPYTPTASNNYVVTPGYYRSAMQTFCLHPGTYSPMQGSGYLVAPPRGVRALMIEHILDHSRVHPEIHQEDVQLLIWAIEAITPFDQMPAGSQAAGRILLDQDEIATLNASTTPEPKPSNSVVHSVFGALGSRVPLPSEATAALDMATRLKSILTDPNATYAQIEAIAVPPGIAPPMSYKGPTIPHGNWAYIGGQFYMRGFPRNYSQTDLELIFVYGWAVGRDSTGRIVHFSSHRLGSVDVSYASDPAAAVQRFATITVNGEAPGERYTLTNVGFTMESRGMARGGRASCQGAIQNEAECLSRVSWMQRFYGDVASYRKARGLPPLDAALLPAAPLFDFAFGAGSALAGGSTPAWADGVRHTLVNEEAAMGCLLVADCLLRSPGHAGAMQPRDGHPTAVKVAMVASAPASMGYAQEGSKPTDQYGIPGTDDPWCLQNCPVGGGFDGPGGVIWGCHPPQPYNFFAPTQENIQRLGIGGYLEGIADQLGAKGGYCYGGPYGDGVRG